MKQLQKGKISVCFLPFLNDQLKDDFMYYSPCPKWKIMFRLKNYFNFCSSIVLHAYFNLITKLDKILSKGWMNKV